MDLPASTQDIMKHRGNPLKLKKDHLQKNRVEWTAELHSKFVKACTQLGPEYAVPKRILQVMGVPGLTREQIASHLQKYRNSVKSFGADLLSVSSRNKMEKFEGQCTSHTLEGICTPLGTRLHLPGSGVFTTSSSRHLFSDEGFSSDFPPKLGFYGALSTSEFHGQSEQEMKNNLSMLPPPVKEIVFSGDGCKHHGNFAGYVLTGNQISVQLVKLEDLSSSNACKEAQEHYIPAVTESLSISEYSSLESLFHGTMMAGCSSAQEHLTLPMSSSGDYCLQEKPVDDELQCLFDHIVEHGYSPAPKHRDFDYLLGQQCDAGIGDHINWDFDPSHANFL